MPPCGLRIQGDSGAKQLGGPEPVALGYEQSELAKLVGGRTEEREREEDRTTLGGRLGEATQASARQEAEETRTTMTPLAQPRTGGCGLSYAGCIPAAAMRS